MVPASIRRLRQRQAVSRPKVTCSLSGLIRHRST